MGMGTRLLHEQEELQVWVVVKGQGKEGTVIVTCGEEGLILGDVLGDTENCGEGIKPGATSSLLPET